MQFHRKHISGGWLEKNGWTKEKLTWTKGNDILKYDGATWLFNNQKVEFTDQLK